MENTNIEWCDATFNPWIGCTHVHAGCTNCYAEAFAKRYGKARWGPGGTRVRTSPAYWRQPLKWDRKAAEAGVRARVFCASLADVFEDWGGSVTATDHGEPVALWHGPSRLGVDAVCTAGGMLVSPWHKTTDGGPVIVPGYRRATLDDLRADLFRLIDATPHLDWLLLTKRPENIRRMWPLESAGMQAIFPGAPGNLGKPVPCVKRNCRHNVWLGTSISDQETADKQLPALLECRDLAPVLFLSVESLLGPVDLRTDVTVCDYCGRYTLDKKRCDCPCGAPLIQDPYTFAERINWVIVGGESGPHRRPCKVEWIASIAGQCRDAGVPCFVKQDAAAKPGQQGRIPDQLWRVKQFPEVAHAC